MLLVLPIGNCLKLTAIESVSEVARIDVEISPLFVKPPLPPSFLPSFVDIRLRLIEHGSLSLPPSFPPSLLSFLFRKRETLFRKSPSKEGGTWSERETWSCHLLCVVGGGETLPLVLGPFVYIPHLALAIGESHCGMAWVSHFHYDS